MLLASEPVLKEHVVSDFSDSKNVLPRSMISTDVYGTSTNN